MLIHGNKIRLLREQRGYTLSRFAKIVNISISYLSEIEREAKQPSLKTVSKIAEALNIPKNQLIKTTKLDSLGKKLKQVREEQGMTQQSLAEEAKLSAGLIGQIEHDKVQPSLKTIEKIASVLGTSPCYFVLESYDGEEMIPSFNPELRELLQDEQVQAVLRQVCTMNGEELKFVLNFIQLFKRSGLSEAGTSKC
ncbi:transcriptional regulator with XRE-family HTH domain [Desulfitispora alkaliphila]|uniref:helix-turn-helix domain-containing protein n=1 Tax=Desulfitispora alkaliphila TaxID=622674 RepID=UPI003D24E99C